MRKSKLFLGIASATIGAFVGYSLYKSKKESKNYFNTNPAEYTKGEVTKDNTVLQEPNNYDSELKNTEPEVSSDLDNTVVQVEYPEEDDAQQRIEEEKDNLDAASKKDETENNNIPCESVGNNKTDTHDNNGYNETISEQINETETEEIPDEKPTVDDAVPDDFNKQDCILNIVSKSDVYTRDELEEMSDEDLFTLLRFIYDTDKEEND